MDVGPEEFARLIERALDALPPSFASLLDNVVVVQEDEASVEDLVSVGLDPELDDLLGLYHGTPQLDRGSGYSDLPDRVVIYRLAILAECQTDQDVIREVRDTVIHELGHHFGLSDSEMPY